MNYNYRTDTADEDIKLNAYEAKAYCFNLMKPEDAILLCSYLIARSDSIVSGVFCQGGLFYVDVEYLERFEELLDHLGIIVVTETMLEKLVKARRNK